MEKKDLEFIEQLSTLDNKSLEQIAIKFDKIVETRQKKLLNAVKNKDTSTLIELSKFFKHDHWSVDSCKILYQLNYNKNDIEFMNYLMNPDNYSIMGNNREKILFQYLSQSLKDADFYHLVKNDFSQEVKDVIKTKFSNDGLKDVTPNIFLELIQTYDLKLSIANFKDYVQNDSFTILKIIVESGVFSNFLNINHEKIKDLSLFYFQEKSAQFLIDAYNLKEKASFFFSDDESAENFCKNSKIDFFTYVLNNFDFENDQKYVMYFMHHLGKTKSEEKWKIGIDCLVKNHIDNPDFIEKIKRKIEISQVEEYKEIARIQFQHSFLESSLKPKSDLSKKIKI